MIFSKVKLAIAVIFSLLLFNNVRLAKKVNDLDKQVGIAMNNAQVWENIANQNADFAIYPNPVGNQLNISGNLGKVKSLQIYDMTGKLMKDISNTLNSEHKSIDVSQLIPNTYILRIDGKSIKFIKK